MCDFYRINFANTQEFVKQRIKQEKNTLNNYEEKRLKLYCCKMAITDEEIVNRDDYILFKAIFISLSYLYLYIV